MSGSRSGRSSRSKNNSPAVSRSGSPADKKDDVWTCIKCQKDFSDENSHILECQRCDQHMCRTCVGLKTAQYNAISDRSDIHWFCPPCEEKVFNKIKQDLDIEKRCKEYFETLEKRFDGLEKKVDDKMLEINNKFLKIDEMLKPDGKNTKTDHKAAISKEDISKVVKDELKISEDEKKDRENRKLNIVIFEVPEPEEILKDEVVKKDTTEILRVFNDVMEAEIEQEDLVHVTRLGKKTEGKTRPIRCRFASEEKKKDIFMNLAKLRDDTETHAQFKVDHDQTPLQRKEGKDMIEKANTLQKKVDSKKWKFLVKGPPWNRYIKKVQIKQTDH